MKNIFNTELVRFNVEVDNPREAILLAGQLLVDNGDIDRSYVADMIDAYKTHGSYIVLAPGLAMPHATVNNNVFNTSISLITLKKPIIFGHEKNDPVKVVMAIASENNEEHLENLKKVVELLQNKRIIEKIHDCNNYSELEKLIGGISE